MTIIILVCLIIVFLMFYSVHVHMRRLHDYQAHCEETIRSHHTVLNINKNQILLFSEILQMFATRIYNYGTEEEKDLLANIIERYTNDEKTPEQNI